MSPGAAEAALSGIAWSAIWFGAGWISRVLWVRWRWRGAHVRPRTREHLLAVVVVVLGIVTVANGIQTTLRDDRQDRCALITQRERARIANEDFAAAEQAIHELATARTRDERIAAADGYSRTRDALQRERIENPYNGGTSCR